MRTFTITDPGRYLPPADMKGKWHLPKPISGVPACGSLGLLNEAAGSLHGRVGQSSADVHPLVCRRCLWINERNRRSRHADC